MTDRVPSRRRYHDGVPPVFAPLVAPVSPPEQWVLPATLDEPAARDTARSRATRGVTRPSDAEERVRITSARPMWVPFWRVEVAIDGWVVDHSSVPGASTTSIDGVSTREAVCVCARRGFGSPQSERRDTKLHAADVKLPPNAIVLRASAHEEDPWLSRAPRVDADIDAPEADAFARWRGKSGVTSHNTVVSSTKVTVARSQFVWALFWWVDYAYAGEAHPSGEGEFFVAFSAHDGAVLAEDHPSKVRAVTARVRHLLSFDARGLAGSVFGKRPS